MLSDLALSLRAVRRRNQGGNVVMGEESRKGSSELSAEKETLNISLWQIL